MAFDLPPLMKASEVALFFSVHQKTVYSWIGRGKLSVVRTPMGGVRVTRESVLALVGEGSEKVGNNP